MGYNGFGQQQRGAYVDIENAGIVLGGCLLDRVGPEDACVVDQDINLVPEGFSG